MNYILQYLSYALLYTISVPSGPPQNIAESSISSRSAVISWAPPREEDQNGIITNYTVEVERAGGSDFLVLVVSSTSANITSLKPFRDYFISIAASTSIGRGPFSSSLSIVTLEAGKVFSKITMRSLFLTACITILTAPTSSPLNLNGSTVDSASILLLWDPPSNDTRNGIIREYKVKVTTIETGILSIYSSYSTFAEITELHAAYTYHCSVAAFTVGLGPYSTPVNVSTSEDGES